MPDMTQQDDAAGDETEIRELITRWSAAVRDESLAGIRADHDLDILMFDVPPPFLSRGLDAYMATWQTFFSWQAKPVEFDLRNVEITAGTEVAFATAIGRCGDLSSGKKVELEFRLTMGFRKHDGRWRVVHEHHSIPATDAPASLQVAVKSEPK
jgi:ketosteroid isomerase-like protein